MMRFLVWTEFAMTLGRFRQLPYTAHLAACHRKVRPYWKSFLMLALVHQKVFDLIDSN